MSFPKPFLNSILISIIVAVSISIVHAQSGLSIDQRIAIVEKKIEGGVVRGDLTRDEYSRLKPRLAVVKYKRAKLGKGLTEQAYKDLDHYLLGLEIDTDRLINNFKRR